MSEYLNDARAKWEGKYDDIVFHHVYEEKRVAVTIMTDGVAYTCIRYFPVMGHWVASVDKQGIDDLTEVFSWLSVLLADS